jgi:hypothetical protein
VVTRSGKYTLGVVTKLLRVVGSPAVSQRPGPKFGWVKVTAVVLQVLERVDGPRSGTGVAQPTL